MRKICFYTLLIGCLFITGCKSKKTVVSGSGSGTVKREVKKTPKNDRVVKRRRYKTADDPFPLPVDNGIFMTYTFNSTEDYINTFSDIAMKEMKAYGIPASITLAQGILESSSGQSKLARRSNNHFGIKCHSGWLGPFVRHDDDAKDECFRKYNNPFYSFRDHSIFLSTKSRYAFLFEYRKDNYIGWAKGLKEAGYATDRKYPQKLINLIKKHELYKYDKIVLSEGYKPKQNIPKESEYLTHVVSQGETLYAISRKYGISVNDIKHMNDLDSDRVSKDQVLVVKLGGNNSEDTKKPKNVIQHMGTQTGQVTNSTPSSDKHTVKQGETLFSISKMYSLSVEDLKKMNGLTSNSLNIGQVITVNNEIKNSKVNTNEVVSNSNQTGGIINHVVSKGDTLYNISKRYGVTVDSIKNNNSLQDNNISVGQQLIIKR